MTNPLVYNGTAYATPLHPTELSVYQSLTPLSTANMTLPEYESVKLLDMVLIITPDSKQEAYRVASITTDTDTHEQSVYLEHCACTMGDYVIPDNQVVSGKTQTLDITGTIPQVLSACLGYQIDFDNETVDFPPKWTAGTVDSSLSSVTIYAVIGGMTVLDAINDMMTQIPAYMAVFVGGEDNWHVDIVQRPTTPVCEARLSRNIENCEISTTTQGLCTRVISSSLPNGSKDSANIREKGVHAENMMLNDNLTDAQKDAIASAYLAAHSVPAVSVTISGVELAKRTGLSLDRFDIGTVCRLTLPDLGIGPVNEVIVDKRYPDLLDDPEAVTFTLANAVPDLSISVAQVMKASGMGGGSSKAIAKEVKEEHKRYEIKEEKTDQYFRWLATDSEWREIEGKWEQNITAYAQIVATANNIQRVYTQTGISFFTEEFNPHKAYYIGDKVWHQGIPYKFIKDHTAETGWDATEVEEIKSITTELNESAEGISYIFSQSGIVTEVFDENKDYNKGMRVVKDNVAYEFTQNYVHGQGWSNAHVTAVQSLQTQITGNSEALALKASKGDLDNYVEVDEFGSRLVSSLKNGDQSLKAEVATAINTQSGDSIVNITGDRVNIDAGKSANIGNVLYINSGGALWIKRNVAFGGDQGPFVTINNGSVNAPTIQVNSGGSLVFGGSPSEQSPVPSVTITRADAARIMGMSNVSASVANNILTIVDASGTTVNFSKATSVSGEWGSRATPESPLVPNGTLYVKATQTNRNTTTGLDETTTVGSMDIHLHNSGHWGSSSTQGEDVNVYYYRVVATQGSSAASSETGLSNNVDATGRYRAGSASVGLKTFTSGKKASWIDDEDPLHPATYYISTNGRVNASTGNADEDADWFEPTEAINYGKTLVTVQSVTRAENCSFDTENEEAYDDVTVLLTNGETWTDSVDFSEAYKAGLDGDSAVSSLNYAIELVDENGDYVDEVDWQIDVTDIYQQGVDDATPVTRTYIYNSSGEKVHIRATSDITSQNYVGWLYPNTPVTVTGTSNLLRRITYDGITGWVSPSALVDSTSRTPSPTLYPGQIGWVPEYAYTSYVFAATGDTVWIRSNASTSASIVCAVPVGANISCKVDPNGFTGEWMEVKYGSKTGYMMARFIAGTNEFYAHGGGSGMDDTYRYVTRVLSVDSSSVPMYVSATTGSPVVATVPHNSVIYCAQNHVDFGGAWMQVKYGNSTGYMQAKYIRGTDACNQEQEDAAERIDIYVSGIYYTGSKTGVVNFANLFVYYTYNNSAFDTFRLKGSKSECTATDTRYNANSNMIRQVESDDERMSGETVHVVFNDGSEVEKTVVWAV